MSSRSSSRPDFECDGAAARFATLAETTCDFGVTGGALEDLAAMRGSMLVADTVVGSHAPSTQQNSLVDPLLTLWPALFISVTVLGINLLGDGLRERLEPALVR
jgi:hypothetical protein